MISHLANPPLRRCAECSRPFEVTPRNRATRLYCSATCRMANRSAEKVRRARRCRACGASPADRPGRWSVFCSPECRPRKASTWRAEVVAGRCEECGAPWVSSKPERRFCSDRCRRRVERRRLGPPLYTEAKKSIDQRRRAAKRGATAERVVSLDVFERDRWQCGLCEGEVDPLLRWPDPWSATLDHVVPLSEDGAHTYANTQLAHARCNFIKGNRLRAVLSTRTKDPS